MIAFQTDDHDLEKRHDFPLPEDFDLQAFLPLVENFKGLNFRQVIKGHNLDEKTITNLRALRLEKQGLLLTSNDWSGRKVLQINDEGQFEAIEEPLPPGLLEKLRNEFKLKDQEEEKREEVQYPQEAEVPKVTTKKTKNVALAAILRGQQQQEQHKSVTFKTPSPNHSEDSQASQEDLNKPSYLTRTPQRPLRNQAPMRPLPMDFSVPPPPIPRPFVPPPWPPLGQPRPVDPAALVATFGGPSYSLFAGNNPSWSLGSNERPRSTRPPPPPHQGQNFMFQSGPSPLERLLQQNPRFPPSNK